MHAFQGVEVRARDQYGGQSVEEIERVAKEDKSAKLVRDGLSVGISTATLMFVHVS